MKLPAINQNTLIIGGVAVVALYVFIRGFKGAAKDLAKGAVNAADGAISGAAIGIGEAFGIPETSMTECEKAQAEGRTFDASLACPAGTFLRGLFS